jgi:hypothetical protein
MTDEELEWSDEGRWGPCPKRTYTWFLLFFACCAFEAGGAYLVYQIFWGL